MACGACSGSRRAEQYLSGGSDPITNSEHDRLIDYPPHSPTIRWPPCSTPRRPATSRPRPTRPLRRRASRTCPCCRRRRLCDCVYNQRNNEKEEMLRNKHVPGGLFDWVYNLSVLFSSCVRVCCLHQLIRKTDETTTASNASSTCEPLHLTPVVAKCIEGSTLRLELQGSRSIQTSLRPIHSFQVQRRAAGVVGHR